MIEDKLRRIEERISKSENMSGDNKDAVLGLLAELKEEIGASTESVEEGVKQGITEMDHEDEGIIKSAFNDINSTISEFEESHPKLVQIVNSICTQLSNSGL